MTRLIDVNSSSSYFKYNIDLQYYELIDPVLDFIYQNRDDIKKIDEKIEKCRKIYEKNNSLKIYSLFSAVFIATKKIYCLKIYEKISHDHTLQKCISAISTLYQTISGEMFRAIIEENREERIESVEKNIDILNQQVNSAYEQLNKAYLKKSISPISEEIQKKIESYIDTYEQFKTVFVDECDRLQLRDILVQQIEKNLVLDSVFFQSISSCFSLGWIQEPPIDFIISKEAS